eukprot:scaffold1154_cov310-Pinguiococcus_pyrenoidosus.AAC.25
MLNFDPERSPFSDTSGRIAVGAQPRRRSLRTEVTACRGPLGSALRTTWVFACLGTKPKEEGGPGTADAVVEARQRECGC